MFFLGLVLGALTVVGVVVVRARRRSDSPARVPTAGLGDLPVGVMVCDPAGVVVETNASLGSILGLDDQFTLMSAEDLAGLDLSDIDGSPVPYAEQPVARALRGEAAPDSVLGRQMPDGSRRWFLINTSQTAEATLVTFADISGRIEHLSQTIVEASMLRHQALYDGLTGLPNRTLLMDRLTRANDRASRRGSATALLVIDMDGFKAVNDTLGHAAGDEVLVQVAFRLRSALRNEDTAVRLGGDEFVVLCEDLDPETAETAATAIAERMRDLLNEPYMTTAGPAATWASLGMSIAPPGTSVDLSLLHLADEIMLGDKRDRKVSRGEQRAEPNQSAARAPRSSTPADQVSRVFIVDDDAAMRLLASRIIDVAPAMTVVGESADGLSAIREIIEVEPDIVLCDVMMPGVSGPEVVRAVRAERPGQRFAFWSATTVDQLERHHRSLGVPYVQKDHIEELPTRLADVLSGLGQSLDKTA
ncbi:diguanylate cyclase domain-containing protein [Euzebya tangerina]|uniref:diguanylate cyclase domain-containing protein n=1 Tax=Euzebya tangerina TaxID=591198 RepID=UPI000E318E37|nr:diguanylate cyclase [Euzebya tangerina]